MKNNNEKIRNFINKAKENNTSKKKSYKQTLAYEKKIAKLKVDKDTKTVDMAIEYLNSVNMLVLFGFFNKLGENFKCDFITTEKSISFMSKTLEEGKKKLEEEKKKFKKYIDIEVKEPEERLGFFVSKIIVKGGAVMANVSKENDKYYLNIDDMGIDNIGVYEIINNCTYCRAIKELCEKLDVRVTYIKEAEKKFKINLELIYKIDKKNYPSLSKLLGNGEINHRDRIKSIYEVAEIELYNGLLDVNRREVISITLGNLSKTKKISLSQLTPMINVFCLLGFLEKVKPNEMPNSNSPLKYGKHTSIFYIPEVTENTLKQAKEKVIIVGSKTAFNAGVKRTSLNRKSELKVRLKTSVFKKYQAFSS